MPRIERKSAVTPGGLKAMRIAGGLSQSELAARMGVSRVYVGHMEAGRNPIGLARVYEVAVALGLNPASLDDRLADRPDCGPGLPLKAGPARPDVGTDTPRRAAEGPAAAGPAWTLPGMAKTLRRSPPEAPRPARKRTPDSQEPEVEAENVNQEPPAEAEEES